MKDLEKIAKRISATNGSCNFCVYYKPEIDSVGCWYPHSDLYMDIHQIDACYEGVLKYLERVKASFIGCGVAEN